MGTMLFVWSTSPATEENAPLGRDESFGVVLAAMVAVAVAMIVLMLAGRLARPVLMVTVVVESLFAGAVGALAMATLITEPGLALLLGFGCAMTFPVALQIARPSSHT